MITVTDSAREQALHLMKEDGKRKNGSIKNQ